VKALLVEFNNNADTAFNTQVQIIGFSIHLASYGNGDRFFSAEIFGPLCAESL